jgi:hypothetical protein
MTASTKPTTCLCTSACSAVAAQMSERLATSWARATSPSGISTAHGALVLPPSTAPTTALTMAESGVAP